MRAALLLCVCAALWYRFARANGMDKVEFVILDLTPVPHIDSMGCHFLEELNEVRGTGCSHWLRQRLAPNLLRFATTPTVKQPGSGRCC